MISPEYKELVTRLATKTSAGQVNWKLTTDEKEFIVFFKNLSLAVRKGWGEWDRDTYIVFTLRNSEAKEIDSFVVSDSDTDWILVSDLFDAARRKAHNVEVHLKNMLGELSGSGPVGRDDDDIPF